MRVLIIFGLMLGAMAGALRGLITPAAAGDRDAAGVRAVRVGMVRSLFRDTPEAMVSSMMQPFSAIIESQTGIVGQMVPGGEPVNLGRMLAEDKVHLAVFHGFEFGWAQQACPCIRPLVIAVNQQRHLRAMVLVSADAKVEKMTDLQGKAFAIPQKSREHCHLFVERGLQATGCEPKKFFSQITNPTTIEDALDDVVDNVVQGALVDGVSLDGYKYRKPARFTRLKVIEQSEVFPAAVVAYRPGALDDATISKFRDGMINANKGVLGRQFMTLWKMTGFEPVPADYDRIMAAILKVYPAPAPTK
jgi:ABC-type phosphate/phosphonate transport system substrate-binding protein